MALYLNCLVLRTANRVPVLWSYRHLGVSHDDVQFQQEPSGFSKCHTGSFDGEEGGHTDKRSRSHPVENQVAQLPAGFMLFLISRLVLLVEFEL